MWYQETIGVCCTYNTVILLALNANVYMTVVKNGNAQSCCYKCPIAFNCSIQPLN